MKKYFYLFVAAIAALSFASCNGNDPVNPGKDATYEISVSDIEYYGATISVAPSNDTIAYFWNLVDKASLDTYFDGDLDSLVNYELEYYQEEYEEYGDLSDYDIYSLQDFLEYMGYVVSGKDSYSFESLDPSTEYVVYAFSYDAANNKALSAVATKNFTTAAMEKISLSFTTSVNDTALFITPSDASAYWWCASYDKDSLTDWGYKNAQEYFDDYIDYIGSYVSYYSSYGYDWTDFLNQGSVYYLFEDFEAGHTYKFACAGVENHGIQNSDLVILEYTAADAAKTPSAPVAIQAKKVAKAPKNANAFVPGKKAFAPQFSHSRKSIKK